MNELTDIDGHTWPTPVCPNCRMHRWSKNHKRKCAWCGYEEVTEDFSTKENNEKIKEARKPRSEKAVREAELYYKMKGESPPWEYNQPM